MRTILINSQEHRALMIEAISKKNFYLLRQLHEASVSEFKELVYLENFYDLYRYSTFAEEVNWFEVVADIKIFAFIPEMRDNDTNNNWDN